MPIYYADIGVPTEAGGIVRARGCTITRWNMEDYPNEEDGKIKKMTEYLIFTT